MSKDKIEVSMNVYDIPIVVEALEKANKENERLNNIIKEQGLEDKPNYYVKGLEGSLKEYQEEIERLTKQNKALNEMYELTKKEYIRLNNIINELEKWLEESIEKHTEDYLDWKYDRNVYLAGSEKLQNVFDKLQELKGSDKE